MIGTARLNELLGVQNCLSMLPLRIRVPPPVFSALSEAGCVRVDRDGLEDSDSHILSENHVSFVCVVYVVYAW